MLIEKKEHGLVPNDIVVTRLVTGEELVGKLIESYDALKSDFLVLTKPVLLQMQMISAQQAGIGFAPFMVGVDEDGRFAIGTDKLLVQPMRARKELAANYTQATTGLTIPATPGIIKA